MAPPLRKGRQLAAQRVGGVVFLVVIALLVSLAVALYQKRFADVVEVSVKTDAIGNQLTVNGDVKVDGLTVGRITDVRSEGDGATVDVAIDADRADLVSADSVAQLVPKTLFGEKYVSLVRPVAGGGERISEGDVLQQDRSAVAVETEEVLTNSLPLLRTLGPDDLSRTLNALSGALRGRGERIGENAVLTQQYLAQLNPALPQLQRDLVGLADLADTYDQAAPDFLAVLDDLSFSARSLVDQQEELATFLDTTSTFDGSLQSLLEENETRLVNLASESLPSLELYARYSPQYGCFLRTIADFEETTNLTFGGLQPGLHITLVGTIDGGPFQPVDKPLFGDESPPTCRGLEEPREIPFPLYRESRDGYNEEAEARCPEVSQGRRSDETACPGPSAAAQTVSAQSTILDLVSAPLLRTSPDAVPEMSGLLLGPMLRGTTVDLD